MEHLDDLELLCEDLYMMQKSSVEEVRTRSIPYLPEPMTKYIPHIVDSSKNTAEMSIKEAILLGETLAELKPKLQNRNGRLGSSQRFNHVGECSRSSAICCC